jgi:hypothetical protein
MLNVQTRGKKQGREISRERGSVNSFQLAVDIEYLIKPFFIMNISGYYVQKRTIVFYNVVVVLKKKTKKKIAAKRFDANTRAPKIRPCLET